jgi:DNA-binding response OmpR family regulator
MRLLLIEDHRSLREMMTTHLRERGFAVDAFFRGADALAAAMHTQYDAAILDLGLPDIDGLELLRRLRAELAAELPVIILTARDAVTDRVQGLDSGADDYVLKPFDLAEFDARLRTVLRRPGTRRTTIEQFGDLSFDTAARSAAVGDTPLELTRREACLLEELIRANGRTVVRDTLEERIYGFNEKASANALEAVVSRVRRRLVVAASTARIETMRGIGYRLHADAAP